MTSDTHQLKHYENILQNQTPVLVCLIARDIFLSVFCESFTKMHQKLWFTKVLHFFIKTVIYNIKFTEISCKLMYSSFNYVLVNKLQSSVTIKNSKANSLQHIFLISDLLLKYFGKKSCQLPGGQTQIVASFQILQYLTARLNHQNLVSEILHQYQSPFTLK